MDNTKGEIPQQELDKLRVAQKTLKQVVENKPQAEAEAIQTITNYPTIIPGTKSYDDLHRNLIMGGRQG